MKSLKESLIFELNSYTSSDNKDLELIKFVKQHSAEYYEWLMYGDEATDYNSKYEKTFNQLHDNGWEEADESFDYKDETKAKRYVDKMIKKGYDVVEVDGSDTFIYLIHLK